MADSIRTVRPRLLTVLLTRVPAGPLALLTLLGLLIVAVVAPLLWGQAATAGEISDASLPASSAHLLGTDDLGRDVLLRTLVATRQSVLAALLSTALAVAVGVLWGALPAVVGGRTARLGRRSIEVGLAFPVILVALAVTTILGVGPSTAVIAIGVGFSMTFARLACTLTEDIVRRDYILSARMMGISSAGLLRRYIARNSADQLVVSVAQVLGQTLIATSSLSFLGVGVAAPNYDWGTMLAAGLQNLYISPLAALAPAAAITLSGIGFVFCGEALSRAFNPRLWATTSSDTPSGADRGPRTRREPRTPTRPSHPTDPAGTSTA